MTYAGLALVCLGLAALVAVGSALVVRPGRRWWLASLLVGALLLVLTAVFDSLMIAADLFRYDTSALLGAKVLLMPVEDFAWPIASVLVLPALWELAGALLHRGPTSTGDRGER